MKDGYQPESPPADEVPPTGPSAVVRPFPQRVMLEPPSTVPVTIPAGQKFGLYPLGQDDVVMSAGTLNTILQLMETGTLEDRRALSQNLRNNFNAFFPGT